MKTFLAPAFFVLTLVIGLTSVSVSRFHLGTSDCNVWDKSTLNRPLFRLKEARELLGREVRVKPESWYKHSLAEDVTTGRIIHLEMVASDRFFVMVYWGSTRGKTEEPDVRLYDKETIRELEFIRFKRAAFSAKSN